MLALPHRYRVKGAGRITGDVELTAERLTALQSAAPAEFDEGIDRVDATVEIAEAAELKLPA